MDLGFKFGGQTGFRVYGIGRLWSLLLLRLQLRCLHIVPYRSRRRNAQEPKKGKEREKRKKPKNNNKTKGNHPVLFALPMVRAFGLFHVSRLVRSFALLVFFATCLHMLRFSCEWLALCLSFLRVFGFPASFSPPAVQFFALRAFRAFRTAPPLDILIPRHTERFHSSTRDPEPQTMQAKCRRMMMQTG